jgi:hypothetical protein
VQASRDFEVKKQGQACCPEPWQVDGCSMYTYKMLYWRMPQTYLPAQSPTWPEAHCVWPRYWGHISRGCTPAWHGGCCGCEARSEWAGSEWAGAASSKMITSKSGCAAQGGEWGGAVQRNNTDTALHLYKRQSSASARSECRVCGEETMMPLHECDLSGREAVSSSWPAVAGPRARSPRPHSSTAAAKDALRAKERGGCVVKASLQPKQMAPS